MDGVLESGSGNMSLECKVCLDVFSTTDPFLTPRILTTCGHTICQRCAMVLLARGATSIACPFDRYTTPTSDVKKLPKNFALLEVLERKEAREKREEAEKEKRREESLEEIVVEKCAEDESHDGEWYCDKCDAVFCESCFTSNHSKSFNSNHEKIPLSERPYKLPKCPKHPKNIAEFICTNASCNATPKNFCQTCLFTTHKDHTFEELDAKITKKKEELRGILDEAREKQKELEEKLKKVEMFGKVYSTDSGETAQLMEDIEEWFMRNMNAAKRRVAVFREEQQRKVKESRTKLEEDLMKVRGWRRELRNAIGAKEGFDFEKVEEVVQRKVKGEEELDKNKDAELFEGYPNCIQFCVCK